MKKKIIPKSKLFFLSADELVNIEEELGMEPGQGVFPVYLTPTEQEAARYLGIKLRGGVVIEEVQG